MWSNGSIVTVFIEYISLMKKMICNFAIELQ